MNIKPIKTEDDYHEALKETEKLMVSQKDTPEGDRLDVLVTLLEAYEEKQHPILPPEPVEAIIHQMESQGLSRKDLIPLIGSRARVSEILNKKRALSITMIRELQKSFGENEKLQAVPMIADIKL